MPFLFSFTQHPFSSRVSANTLTKECLFRAANYDAEMKNIKLNFPKAYIEEPKRNIIRKYFMHVLTMPTKMISLNPKLKFIYIRLLVDASPNL